MTVPTTLSLLRIGLTFAIIGCLWLPGLLPKIVALVGFLIASFTDWLDGYLARRLRQMSSLGALIDPIADKILVLGMFLALLSRGLIPWWMVLIIFARELMVTVVRLLAVRRGVILSASREGKQKMVSQVTSIIVALVVLIVRSWPGHPAMLNPLRSWLELLLTVSLWLAVGFTLFSGSVFFWRHRAVVFAGCHYSQTA